MAEGPGAEFLAAALIGAGPGTGAGTRFRPWRRRLPLGGRQRAEADGVRSRSRSFHAAYLDGLHGSSR